ncbi:hypothetical protein ACS0TY_014815 [Phlomoides rotata]
MQNSEKAVDDEGKKKRCTTSCEFRLPRWWELISPVRYLKQFGEKVAAAVARVTTSKSHHRNISHPKTSMAPVLDSQRTEAIHDCIDFINSSSNFPRSNSVAR